ncbi:MAG TPA: hypothetical protein VMW35_00100 [Myxococcota bacterium]|nr:hypothetical protein [Myxococcota bacterium]
MEQETLTVVARIQEVDRLRCALRRIEDEVREARRSHDPLHEFPFDALEKLHFARLVIVEDTASAPTLEPRLVLATDFDGTREDHLAELVARAEKALDQVFGCCRGYPSSGSRADKVEFLRNHSVEPICTYRGHPGRSVGQIRLEEQLRKELEDVLDRLDARAARDPWSECRRQVEGPGSAFRWALSPAPPTRLTRAEKWWLRARTLWGLRGDLFRVLRDLPILLAAERTDGDAFVRRERDRGRDGSAMQRRKDAAALRRALEEREGRCVQNELTSVTEIRPETFRRRALEVMLRIANLRARTRFDRGDLAGIPSIHFARWVILEHAADEPKRDRLLFLTNYDGSWESYLGDFIDQAADRLTAIWGHTRHFPPTRRIFLGGAHHEALFKRFVREHQLAAQVWYAAYPDLSVQNVNRNSELRLGLGAGAPTPEERLRWLDLF